MKMKVAVVLGTRPEIIKMASIIRQLGKRQVDYFILHTGQHYSYYLAQVFFDQLKLPPAKYNVATGSSSHARQTAKMLIGVEEILQKESPDIVLIEGDTNSVLAAALAATKLFIKVGHVEAGLRSYDRRMPEEINRILVDHCSDYLFAPTHMAKTILLSEGIPENKVFVTGNTIVDAVYQHVEIARQQGNFLGTLGIKPKEYFLVTLHRQETVDDPVVFASVLRGLDEVAAKFCLPVIYSIHPRSRRRMNQFNLKPRDIKLIPPVDFLTFLELESKARLVLTDSGGVQEETCILGVPCVTIRNNTERPETVEVGSNIVAGTSPDRIIECVTIMLGRRTDWQNPFGDGRAGERIVSIITEVSNG